MKSTTRITLCLCLLFALAELPWVQSCGPGGCPDCPSNPDIKAIDCDCPEMADHPMCLGRIDDEASHLMSTIASKYTPTWMKQKSSPKICFPINLPSTKEVEYVFHI